MTYVFVFCACTRRHGAALTHHVCGSALHRGLMPARQGTRDPLEDPAALDRGPRGPNRRQRPKQRLHTHRPTGPRHRRRHTTAMRRRPADVPHPGLRGLTRRYDPSPTLAHRRRGRPTPATTAHGAGGVDGAYRHHNTHTPTQNDPTCRGLGPDLTLERVLRGGRGQGRSLGVLRGGEGGVPRRAAAVDKVTVGTVPAETGGAHPPAHAAAISMTRVHD